MSVANKIFTNTLWQVVIRTINIFIGVFNLALITRILGQEGFGFYTTIFAFVQMLMIFADLGLYLSLLREVSAAKTQAQENKVVNNIFTIRFVASLVMVVLAPIVIQAFPYSQEVKTGVIYFILAFFFQSLISTLTAVFSKKLAMPKVAVTDLFNKIIYLALIYYLFTKSGSLNQVLLAQTIVNFLTFILFYKFLRHYVKLRLAWDFAYWRHVWKYTWPLAVTVVLNLIYFKADTLVLSGFRDAAEVGLYGAPYRVLEVLTTFPHMFMSLILPLFTAAWIAKNFDKLKNTLQHTFDFFSMLTILMIVGTWLISKPLMIMLAGAEFAGSGPILNILVVATASIFFGTLFTYLVVALRLQKKMIKFFLIAAVVGLIGYFIFIPQFSYWAAAYTTLAIEVLIAIFACFLVKKYWAFKLNYYVMLKSLLAGFVTLAVLWSFKDFNIFLTAILAVIIYALILILTRAVSKDLIKEVFKRPS
jgi:O-antigen/teichoic acid export membrane protein